MNVLEFKAKTKIKPRAPMDRYSCMACQSQIFTLHEDGTVHCGSCTMKIKNLQVEAK